jgi:hypothetical protein
MDFESTAYAPVDEACHTTECSECIPTTATTAGVLEPPFTFVPAFLDPRDEWFLTTAGKQGIAEAEAQIAAVNFDMFASMEDAIRHLKS